MRLSFLFLLFFSSSVFAGHLWLPKEVTIISINGQPYQNSFFASDTELALTPGQQLLVLEYKDIFENYDDDDHTTIKSEPYVVIFNVGKQDKLTLKLPGITGEQQARDFAGKFNIRLLNASNSEHPVFVQGLMKYKAARMLTHPPAVPKDVFTDPQVKPDFAEETDALVQLKHWWQLASEKQKRHFMQYLLLQEHTAHEGQEGTVK